jgi:multicomponent Na+:H+ antiporter subunit E
METGNKNLKTSIFIKGFLLRFVLFTGGWLILVGGQPGDIWFVILGITTTTFISLYAVPPGIWLFRPLGIIRFFPYFLLTAIRGGWDVARRVFFRTIPIDPDFITIPHDKDERKTLLLAWIISLLPGTASCVIREETIVVHVLDKKLPVTEEILELQKRINEMFAVA